MSLPLVAASPDLARLVNDGFELRIQDGFLVVANVPFVDPCLQVGRGTLVCQLDLAGDRTVPPRIHVAYFGGGTPCDVLGRTLPMVHAGARRRLADGVDVDHMLSSRPGSDEYPDFYAKVTTYVAEIEAHARALEPTASARRSTGSARTPGESPFRYVDTATSRAGIGEFSARLAGHSVGIVGLGGSGSYVLDLVAKTPVRRIHIWDADLFEQHSAFRCPGAPTMDELAARPAKVDHLAKIYSRMHAGVVPHRTRLAAANVGALALLDFVFVAVDSGRSRQPIVDFLERTGKPFIDIGMGLHASDGGIVGTVRVTTSTPAMRAHVHERGRIPFNGDDRDDPYSTNIQIADLNCLNAALAVIRWKRHLGFYADFEREHWSAYSVDGNVLFNDERPQGGVA